MRKRLACFATLLLLLAVVSCQIAPNQLPTDSLKVWLVGLDGKTLLLDSKADETVPPPPVKKDGQGVYYGSRLALTKDQFEQLKRAKNPAVVRVLYDEKKAFLLGEVFPIGAYLKESTINLPGEQLISVRAYQFSYQVLDYPLPILQRPKTISPQDLRQQPWNQSGILNSLVTKRLFCYLTKETPCELERCLRYPPEFNFESIEVVQNSGPALIKTLTFADCAINLTAGQAFSTAGPTATFKVRAYLKRLRAAPAGPVPTYSFRYSNSSLPSRLEASHLVAGDFSSLATLAVGSTQLVEFQLSWLLPASIGPKDFFIVNNATFDAIVAKGGCTTPNTMQFYAEDRFRFNLNGAVGGCL
ncbi:hypothetical protein GCM10027299_48900 [Larkinella ripae]